MKQALGQLDGLELHLKEAPKCGPERQHRREHEHLDAAAGVDGIEAFYYIVCFGGQPTAD